MDFNKNENYFNDSSQHYLRNNIKIMHYSIKDRDNISNHIIICGLHASLFHFNLPLRVKYLQEDVLKWILILAQSLPQHLFEAFINFLGLFLYKVNRFYLQIYLYLLFKC